MITAHNAAVAAYNALDFELYQDGFWADVMERPRSEWHAPDALSAGQNERVELAWELAEQGHKLCLSGILSVMGGLDSIGYTPREVRRMSDYPLVEFRDHSLPYLRAHVSVRLVKPE